MQHQNIVFFCYFRCVTTGP